MSAVLRDDDTVLAWRTVLRGGGIIVQHDSANDHWRRILEGLARAGICILDPWEKNGDPAHPGLYLRRARGVRCAVMRDGVCRSSGLRTLDPSWEGCRGCPNEEMPPVASPGPAIDPLTAFRRGPRKMQL